MAKRRRPRSSSPRHAVAQRAEPGRGASSSRRRDGGLCGGDSLDQVYGIHAVQALLDRSASRIRELLLLDSVSAQAADSRLQSIRQQAREQGVSIQEMDKAGFERLLGEVRHQGVLARTAPMPALSDSDLDDWLDKAPERLFLLVLDGVQDPHNLGACLRSAEAAGVQAVIVPKDRAVGLTATARKVAVGAAERLPFFQVTNLVRTMDRLADHGVWFVGAAGEAPNTLYEADLSGSLGIVMGSEEKGLRRLTREHCQVLVHIPMQAVVESLNVSVATGICLFEAVRQRRLVKPS